MNKIERNAPNNLERATKPKRKRRYQGSTLVAYVVSFLLLLLAAFFACGGQINWVQYKRCIDIASCLTFSLVLWWWAKSGKLTSDEDHIPKTWFKIGNETLTMVVGVLTAVIAILTLAEAASKAK
jgi:hypothetical protein